MTFNSLDFAIFLPLVFLFYWLGGKKNRQTQNLIILAASYLFYSWWDWRFLLLILFSTLVDFIIGNKLQTQKKLQKRKLLLWTSIFANLGLLFFFKYYNFFIENFSLAFSLFGNKISPNSLNIILPVGISFYTFQTMSYTIDIYRRKLLPAKDFISFASFVSFFPQLVAGPIERATNLLPQFYSKRKFNYLQAVDGMRQILWGLFKKVVIADNCAEYANLIFDNAEIHSGSTLVLGTLFFTFQIYGDFSGYSDIAIGTSRLFGFNLKQNFATPYFSRNIAEFWRRWHISLSTWFRDYLYIPLGGSRGSTLTRVRNTFIIFLISGLWHGANWTFVVWGALNALFIIPSMILKTNRKSLDIVAKGNFFPSVSEFISILFTFCLTSLAWIFFRAENINQAWIILCKIFSTEICSAPTFEGDNLILPLYIMIGIFILIEWIGRDKKFALEKLGTNWPSFYRLTFYYLIIFTIIWFSGKEQQFIYFQF
ncbi:MAG: membrane-bound O-acyltransferase family protein [Bacteroidetes bacterium]|nr:MAG: membrane-bound O-acyltransferase family protein [Bacteroidota bacterium]